MIVEWLLDFLEAGFNLIVGLFPVTDFNPVTMFVNAVPFLGSLNYFIPISELLSTTVAFLVLGGPFMIVSLGVWILAFIRGGSARG